MSHHALPVAGQVDALRDVPAMVERMAEATIRYPFKFWGFGESIAMEALLAAGGASGQWATDRIVEWATDHAPLAEEPLAHVAPGVPLLLVAESAKDDRCSTARVRS